MYIFSLRGSVKSKRDRNVFCLVSRKYAEYGNTEIYLNVSFISQGKFLS